MERAGLRTILIELAHRMAYAPAGPARQLRVTRVGEHWTDAAARRLQQAGLVAFHTFETVGRVGGLTYAGLARLAAAGVSLPPRLPGRPHIDGGYSTPWLNLPAPVEAPRQLQLQLALYPPARRIPRRRAA